VIDAGIAELDVGLGGEGRRRLDHPP